VIAGTTQLKTFVLHMHQIENYDLYMYVQYINNYLVEQVDAKSFLITISTTRYRKILSVDMKWAGR
jgi:hypothetical protein